MKTFAKYVIGVCAVLLSFTAMDAEAVCVNYERISSDFEQTLCPGTENERTVTKTATHIVAYSTEGCEGSSSSGPSGGQTSGGSSGSGGGSAYQGGGGSAVPNATNSTTIDPLTCFQPGCIKKALMGETCQQVNSSVILTNGTYNFTETDLELPARGLDIDWSRHYRSNRVFEKSGARSFGEPLDGPLGFGWMTPYFARIENGDTHVDGRGLYTTFKKDASGNFLPDQIDGIILKKFDSGFELDKLGENISRFDQNGKLVSIDDRLGNKLVLNYDADGLLTSITDATGRTALSFTYNAGGRIETMTDAAGRSVTYLYDGFGNLTEVDGLGSSSHIYTYNTYHGLLSKKNALDEMITIAYEYPDRGIAKKVVDPIGNDLIAQGKPPSGHVKTFTYDFQNGVFLTTDYDGSVTKTTANKDGRLTSKEQVLQGGNQTLKNVQLKQDRTEVITDAGGNQKTVQRDEWFNIIRLTDGEGNITRISWNLQKRPTQLTDPLGVGTKFEYDATGTLLLVKTEAVETPVERVTTYTYTEYGELETVTVDNAVTTIAYDANGLPESITDPLGNKSYMEFDAEGNLKAVVDAEGNRTAMTYDDLGNVLTVTDPINNQTQYAYNIEGRLQKVTDALLRKTNVETDFKGRILAVVGALQNRKEFEYDGVGNLLSITQDAVVTSFAYDEQDRLTSVTDAENNTTTYAYADAGCSECGASNAIPETITDPFGNVSKNLFDKAGNVTGVQDPLTNLTNLAYDAKGQVVSQVDGNGNVTEFKYDQLGRLTKQIDAESGETVFSYDQHDNLLTLTDPEQNTTTFEYDKANRKTKEIRPMGQETVYSYYDNGLLETVKDAKQQVTTYVYDKANRLTEITYADATKDTFGYDKVGNLTSYANPDVFGTMTYDKLNRKLNETVDYGSVQKSFSYTYDARGNKATYTSPEALIHNYTYRKNDQLKTISVDGKTFTFDYDKNRLAKLTFPNGVVTDYGYNQSSWLTSISTNGPNGNILTRNYTHDSVGNIGSKDTEHGLYQFGYDKTYQLTSSDNPTLNDEAYSYDKVGNRQTSASTTGLWSYNQNNELILDTTATYEYDENGNTIKKIENSQETVYEYNAKNRLSKVYLPDGRQATYTYDPFGRRIKKQVANTTTIYVYDNEDVTFEIVDDGVTTVQTQFIHGPDIDQPLSMMRNSQPSYYHADGLGSIVAITDASGNIVQRYSYEAFGQLTASDPTFDNFYTYTGREYDKETGLYYYRARYYDAMEGRFISKDPIGFAGGDVNLYNYVGGNPINYVDPDGLEAWGINVGGGGTGKGMKGAASTAILFDSQGNFAIISSKEFGAGAGKSGGLFDNFVYGGKGTTVFDYAGKGVSVSGTVAKGARGLSMAVSMPTYGDDGTPKFFYELGISPLGAGGHEGGVTITDGEVLFSTDIFGETGRWWADFFWDLFNSCE